MSGIKVRIGNGRMLRLAAGACLLLALAACGEMGRDMRTRPPVDLPPPGFTGSQFVDGAGCTFVRSGYGDVVNWVPRVARDRSHICGQVPTFGATPEA